VFGVTDLISNSGFAGTCPAPNTYRGSTPHGRWSAGGVERRQRVCRAL